jgi:hypothetical protein
MSTSAVEPVLQLIGCSVDAVVSRHLGGLQAMRIIEVVRRKAEQTTSSETARLCIRMKRGKQRTWGGPGYGQRSKLMVVETAYRPLAQMEAEKVRKVKERPAISVQSRRIKCLLGIQAV